MDLLDVRLIIEPIRLIGGIPGVFGQSVASFLLTETSQYVRGLGSDPALAGSLNKCFF